MQVVTPGTTKSAVWLIKHHCHFVGLVCHCHHSNSVLVHVRCSAGNTCTAPDLIGCILLRNLVEDDDGQMSENIIYECVRSSDDDLCNINASSIRQACCSDTDFCNLELIVEPFLQDTTMNPSEITTDSELTTPPVVSTGT